MLPFSFWTNPGPASLCKKPHLSGRTLRNIRAGLVVFSLCSSRPRRFGAAQNVDQGQLCFQYNSFRLRIAECTCTLPWSSFLFRDSHRTSTGSVTGLRQAQPPGFDRLSHRESTGSATGSRQAQPPDFDRLSHRPGSLLRSPPPRPLSLSKGSKGGP